MKNAVSVHVAVEHENGFAHSARPGRTAEMFRWSWKGKSIGISAATRRVQWLEEKIVASTIVMGQISLQWGSMYGTPSLAITVDHGRHALHIPAQNVHHRVLCRKPTKNNQ